MKNAILLIIFVLTLTAAAGEDVRLAELIKKLDAENFELREQAQKEVLEYCKASADIWSVGGQLAMARKNTSPEVVQRLSRVEEEISPIQIPESEDPLTFVSPGYCGASHIDKTPMIVMSINSLEMLRFYRAVAQTNFNQSFPATDFSRFVLLGISGTGFGRAHDRIETLITRYSFHRDFEKHGLNCRLSLAYGQTDGPNGGTTPGTGGLNYTFSLSSFSADDRRRFWSPQAVSAVRRFQEF